MNFVKDNYIKNFTFVHFKNDDFYDLIEKNYTLLAASVDDYCKRLGINIPEEKRNTYFKRFVKILLHSTVGR